ncbi:MAG: hypothetical protein DWP94_10735 [Flavobacterium sp.]|nr:MAG: hypothetical protein DWP94_10735 [Flavobacterium sp.]
MKVRILLLFIAMTLMGGADVYAQKKDPRAASAKNLYNTLAAMLRQAKTAPDKDTRCEPAKLLASIPRKKLLPAKEALKKEIGKIVDDSLTLGTSLYQITNELALEYLSETKTKTEFLRKLGTEYDKFSFDKAEFDRFYYTVRRAQKSGFKIFEKSFKHGECTVSVKTYLKPTKFKWDTKKYTISNINWDIKTVVAIACPCTTKNKYKVKKAEFEYTTSCSGPMRFNTVRYTYDRNGPNTSVYYGLRFGKIKDPKRVLVLLNCCTKLEDPVKKGSFIAPDEDINDNNNLIDTGLGIGYGSETDTEGVIYGGYLFDIGDVGGNPLFVGPKASVNTTAINGDEIKETRVLIGPTAEYQIPVGAGNTRIVTGINSGYLFGSLDAFGFKRDLSGFAVNAYTGAQFQIGNNLALGVLLNFVEFSNITIKSDDGEINNTSSDTSFLTDRGAISVGVRIGLDKK